MALLVLLAAGCNDRGERFGVDLPLHLANGLSAEQTASIRDALEQCFGDPNAPKLPNVSGLEGLLDLDLLKQAAGEVISHEPGVTQGLYRRHCARCHGVTGDGMGPTALYQHPYPRDFRRGVFKWKRTYRAAKPTPEDLDRVLSHGVAGTAMPSFRLLMEEEREALRHYVVFLSLRGALERELVWYVADELAAGERFDLSDGETQEHVHERLLRPILDAWREAEERVVAAPDLAFDDEREALARGRDLFGSERAGCAKCHGPAGQGGAAPERDYDVWTRERVDFAAVGDVALKRALRRTFPRKESGAPRLIGEPPRGGAEPIDLYRRLHQGIAGTAMPAVGPRAPGEGAALTEEEILALALYVRSIMHSEGGGHE